MTVGRWLMHRLCTPSSLALHGSCIEIKSETFGRIKLIRQRSNGLVKHVEPGPQHKTKQGLRRLGPCGIAWQVSLQVHASSSLFAHFLAEVCYLLLLSTHRSIEFLHHKQRCSTYAESNVHEVKERRSAAFNICWTALTCSCAAWPNQSPSCAEMTWHVA